MKDFIATNGFDKLAIFSFYIYTMEEFASILKHIEPNIFLSPDEKDMFKSVLKVNKIKRKQFLE